MTSELIAVAQSLFNYMLLLSLQLLMILLVRKKIGRRFGAVTAYYLWLLPLLWLPFYWIELPALNWAYFASLLQWNQGSVQGNVSWFQLGLSAFEFDFELPGLSLLNTNEVLASRFWLVICMLWLVVSLALLLLQASHIRYFSQQLGRLTQVKPAENNADNGSLKLPTCFLEGLGSPALFGIFKPLLLLPLNFMERYDAQQRKLILAHEAVHYQRRDNLWNLLATLLRIVFWFNPLVHLSWKFFRLDQEMSCDEIALRQTNPDEGLRYARMLLESMSNKLHVKHQPTLTAWGNLHDIKERTQMIKHHLNHKPLFRPGKWLLLLCILAGSLATAVFTDKMQMSFAAQEPDPALNTQNLSRKVYERIEKIMTLRDQKDYDSALALLDEIAEMNDAGSLNSREQQTLWLFYANIAQIQERYADAIKYNEKILAIKNLDPDIRDQTLNQLGSLLYMLEDYTASIKYFIQYLEVGGKNQADANLRIAYANYQLKNYEIAIPYTEQAIELGDSSKNTYGLLRALYLTTENYPAATAVVKESIELFNDPADIKILSQLEAMEQAPDAQKVLPQKSNDIEKEYLPIKVQQPTYPIKALQKGLQGWAQVSFTVNETGDVVNPIIVDSSLAKVFDQASLEAIAQFKFNPRIKDGIAVATDDVQYVFRYNLSDD